MTSFLSRLIARSTADSAVISPRIPSVFGKPDLPSFGLDAPLEEVENSATQQPESGQNKEKSHLASRETMSAPEMHTSDESRPVDRELLARRSSFAQTAQSHQSFSSELPETAVESLRQEPRQHPDGTVLSVVSAKPASDAPAESDPTDRPALRTRYVSARERASEAELSPNSSVAPEFVAALPIPHDVRSQRVQAFEEHPNTRQQSLLYNPLARAEKGPAETVIQISIGRIEVRATPRTATPQQAARTKQELSLDDYQLRREQRGRR